MLTVGALRASVAQENLGWTIRPDLADDHVLAPPALGATTDNLLAAQGVAQVDFAALPLSANPGLVDRRLALNLLDPAAVPLHLRSHPLLLARKTAGAADAPPDAGVTPSAVDWRNRFGGSWITGIRDQNPCESCWAFAGTALIEAMTHIEHALWTVLSEGDVHQGVGAKCGDGGNLGEVSDFFVAHGLADPGCFAYHTDDVPYTPTPDRDGRSVRGQAFTSVAGGDRKTWLDAVGPLAAWIQVYADFEAWGPGSGPYRKSAAPDNAFMGNHFVLIVGYDDARQCWIAKNSWGTAYGDQGWYDIGFGETGIDTYGWQATQNTNPDPWRKRRLHNGGLLESGNGAPLHRNLEVLAGNPAAGSVSQWWRDGGQPFAWHAVGSPLGGTDLAAVPTLTSTTFNRNFEAVYPTKGGQLHHLWFAQPSGPWNDGGTFGPATCAPDPVGFVQGNYGAPGAFEVVVRVGDTLQHVWRDGGGWHTGVTFGAGIGCGGATLVQSTYGAQGNLEYVAVRTDGAMQHFWRDNDNGMVWNAGVTFGAGISSPAVMIQGQYGTRTEHDTGNFELCVAVGGAVQHWWRANAGDESWSNSATFGHDVAQVVGLAESSWAANLEVVVARTDGQLQHYWRDGNGWHEGPVIGAS